MNLNLHRQSTACLRALVSGHQLTPQEIDIMLRQRGLKEVTPIKTEGDRYGGIAFFFEQGDREETLELVNMSEGACSLFTGQRIDPEGNEYASQCTSTSGVQSMAIRLLDI